MANKSQWTLVASEPEESSTYDRDAASTHLALRDGFSQRFKAWRTRQTLVGWRFGVYLGMILTAVIFILNTGLTFGILGSYGKDQMGKASLATGRCEDIKRYNTVYHLFINILSTLLIGASNYTMQMLSAPTRSEVDRAHAKGKWLDIGVPSWRNLRQVNKIRLTFWIILALSSVPLHLFFNSAIFVTLYQHGYHVVEIAPSFFRTNALEVYSSQEVERKIASSPYSVSDLHRLATNGSLARVDNTNCISEALVPLNTQNLLYLLVTVGDPDKPYNTSDLQYKQFVDDMQSVSGDLMCEIEPGEWACNPKQIDTSTQAGDTCGLCWPRAPELTAKASLWAPFDNTIDYCLNLRAEEQCALEFSFPIMLIICVMNAVKVGMFAFIGFMLKESPLVTLGDAIASFINRPSAEESTPIVMQAETYETNMPVKKKRRWAATTKRRWSFAFLSLALAEAIVIFWLIYAAFATQRGSAIFSIPFATIDPRTIIYQWSIPSIGVSAVIQNALIANIAQPVLSAIYFAFNGLITAMCGANEWNSYSVDMKGLRVSGVPSGAQRTTHFLQLPYKYGGPLMILSVLTHWMVSQAIFVVSVLNDGRLNLGGIDMDYPYYVSCGYSPRAILGVIFLGLAILLYAIVLGALPLKSAVMPVAGSNSMMIEKQCLLEERKYGLEKKALQWGVRRSLRRQDEYVSGFLDMPVNGGQKELGQYSRVKDGYHDSPVN